ncbi:F-box/kelch-repeat protein [Cardamine amara subsp. amara]|uniref:F-box/kelch-repeat protein n=1 Tax=Cardamine amara subsp. amara TaxID=228776 RepID=A0ABD0ZZD1_CARAN
MISDLPRDVAEDVLSRLPVKSMKAVRFACKNWNTVSKSRRFRKRYLAEIKAASDFMVVMVMDFGLYLRSVNLHGIHKSLEPSINHQGKLFHLIDGVEIHKVCHCDGLLLCIPRDGTRMVVWNPYLGETRWFEPIARDPKLASYYAIGYDQSSKSSCRRNYKILRYFHTSGDRMRYEVYYFNRNDTIPITILSDWEVLYHARGASVKGNTYWFAQEKIPPDSEEISEIADFLVCFDFTTERFGPRLSLPIHSYVEDTVTLYSVRDEQLAVLYQPWNTHFLEIWITNKIEPNAVSWNSKVFLAVDMIPLLGFNFPCDGASFLVDEEKKVAVVIETAKEKEGRYAAYVIGEDGYFKEMDFGEASPNNLEYPPIIPYVPSLAQIKQRTGKKKKQIVKHPGTKAKKT